MIGEHRGERQRNGQGDDQSGAHAEADEARDEDDGDRLPERRHEVGDRVIDGHGLVGNQMRFDAERQVGRDPHHRLPDIVAERQDIAAVPHGDAEADRLLPVDAKHRLRRVGRAALHRCDIGQPNHPVPHREVHVEKIGFRLESPGYAQGHGLIPGLERTRRTHDVLALQGRQQNRPVDAQIGQFPHREFDEDPLVLGADDLDLGYVGNEQEPGTDVLDVIPQLPTGEPVGGEAIDDAERVAEPIVEERSDRAGRQGMANIRHQVANLIPGVLHVRSRNRLLQVDEDRGHARCGGASQEVEARCFLELPLEPFRDLRQGILHRRARPRRGYDHRLDDEGGILIAAQTVEGQEPGERPPRS